MNNKNINLNEESNIKSVFEMFKNTKASNEDLLKLLEAKKRLNIRDNDALWLILIIIESYDQNFISTSEKIRTILLDFPDILESKLNYLFENTESIFDQKMLLEIEEKSDDLLNKLTNEITNSIKSQLVKPGSKKIVALIIVTIFSSLISTFLCSFLLFKLGFI
jgi:hypothetical protein